MNDTESRFATARHFLEWAPRQPEKLTAQINVYKNTLQILGWYPGGIEQDLQALVDDCGLLEIGQRQARLLDDCSTGNSCVFGFVADEYLLDDKVRRIHPEYRPRTVRQIRGLPTIHLRRKSPLHLPSHR